MINKKIKYNVLPVLLCVLTVLSVFTGYSQVTVSAENLPAAGNDIKIHMNIEGLESAPDITADAAILLNTHTGDILYEKNSEKIVYPAANVKIMTAIIVLENVYDLESEIEISQSVINKSAGSALVLDPKVSVGEIFTVENLLNAMLLWGANDATLALAEYAAEDIPAFVDKMNAKALELGCSNTVFTNPTGIHSAEMHTTVSDMAKIMFYASKIQKIMDITSSNIYTIPPTNTERSARTKINRNHFVSKGTYSQYYYEYARGMNYGSTAEAGDCLTTIADQSALSYLCVLMGSKATRIPESDSMRLNCFYDARSLFEWAFAMYSYKTVVSTKDKACSVEIRLSANRDNITLVPDADISVLLPQNVDIEREITTEIAIFEDDLVAPVEKGQQLGKLTVYYDGEVVGTARLLSNSDVEPSNILYVLDQIKLIVSGGWFKASVIIFIIIFAFYVIVNLIRKSRKEQRRFY